MTSLTFRCRRKQAVRELAEAVQTRETFAVEVGRLPSSAFLGLHAPVLYDGADILTLAALEPQQVLVCEVRRSLTIQGLLLSEASG